MEFRRNLSRKIVSLTGIPIGLSYFFFDGYYGFAAEHLSKSQSLTTKCDLAASRLPQTLSQYTNGVRKVAVALDMPEAEFISFDPMARGAEAARINLRTRLLRSLNPGVSEGGRMIPPQAVFIVTTHVSSKSRGRSNFFAILADNSGANFSDLERKVGRLGRVHTFVVSLEDRVYDVGGSVTSFNVVLPSKVLQVLGAENQKLFAAALLEIVGHPIGLSTLTVKFSREAPTVVPSADESIKNVDSVIAPNDNLHPVRSGAVRGAMAADHFDSQSSSSGSASSSRGVEGTGSSDDRGFSEFGSDSGSGSGL